MTITITPRAPTRLFYAKSIFIQTISSAWVLRVSKTFLFQAIQFNQTVLIQPIQFSISIDFVYTQLNVYIKQFSLAQVHSLNVSVQFNCQKHFYFKQFSLVKQFCLA